MTRAPVALITGAGNGIGLATCEALARGGYRIVAADRDYEAAVRTIDVVSAAGSEGIAVAADVRSGADISHLGASIADAYGRLDVAVNGAGITPPSSPVQSISEDEWQTVLDINLLGVWRCMAMEIPLMLAAGGGSIVNIASRTGMSGSPGRASYSASKHAVIGLTRSAALELATQGIRVNSVCPGPIATAMITQAVSASPDREQRLASSTAMNRIGEAHEVAAAIAWLAGPHASFVTGIELPVDGGVARGSSSSIGTSANEGRSS